MRKIYFLSLLDNFTLKVIWELQKNLDEVQIKKFFTTFTLFNALKTDTPEIIFIDKETCDTNTFDIITTIKDIDSQIAIAILTNSKDEILTNLENDNKNIKIFEKTKFNFKINDILDFVNKNIRKTKKYYVPDKKQPDKKELSEKKTILLVEDFSSTRKIMSYSLKKAGFEVIEAQDGLEALKYLKTKTSKINIIITDINMPRMDGLSLIRKIKEDKFTETIPIIIVTTEIKPEVKRKLLHLKIDAWIKKPYDFEEFLDTINKLLEK